MFTKPEPDSGGTFGKCKRCLATKCRECNSESVNYREWESDNGHVEYQYRCQRCGYTWWSDGIDY